LVGDLLTEKELVTKHPKLYHMAEDGSWPNINKHGLLSTSVLLTMYGYKGSERTAIESECRTSEKTISCDGYDDVVIRDQKVMPQEDLEKCLLGGMTPQEWYEYINRRIFFWVKRERLEWFLGAREYRNEPHLVITVDTRSLLERYAGFVTLTNMNTGSTIYDRERYDRPRLRGKETFKTIKEYPYYAVDSIVELVVEDGIPDIADVTICVARWIAHKKGYDDPVYEKLEDIWPE